MNGRAESMNWASAVLGAAALALVTSRSAWRWRRKGRRRDHRHAQAPPSLDPHVTSAQVARNVNLHMYETLYARDENAQPVPDLAEGVDDHRPTA